MENKEVNSWENCDRLQKVAEFLSLEDFLEIIIGDTQRLHVIYADGVYKAVRESINTDLEIRTKTTGQFIESEWGIVRVPNERISLSDICDAGKGTPKLPVYRIIGYYGLEDGKREELLKKSGFTHYRGRVDVEVEENGKRIMVEDIELNFKFMKQYAPNVTHIAFSIGIFGWSGFHLDKNSLVYEITKDGQDITEDAVKELYLNRNHPDMLEIVGKMDDRVEFKGLGKTVIFGIETLRGVLAPYYKQSVSGN